MKARGILDLRAACLGVAVTMAAPVWAQKISGEITGTISDATGGGLGGATVTALCEGTGFTRVVTSDPSGSYRFTDLPVCVYRLTAVAAGFKTTNRSVQVAVSTLTKADFRLQLGEKSEEVTVEGAAPVVEFSDKLN